MVYCDQCGTEADYDRYCRICGRPLDLRPILLAMQQHPPTPLPHWVTPQTNTQARYAQPEPPVMATGIGVDTRTNVLENMEKRFTTDTMTAPQPYHAPTAQSGPVLTEEAKADSSRQAARKEPQPDQTPEELLAKIQELEKEKENLRAQVWKTRRQPSRLVGYATAGVGALSLILSAIYASTVLAFIGLGLTFWGVLLLFIRPRKYVRSDLMDSTALSSLKTIDRVMTGLGYTAKGIYIPASNPEKAVVFIPSQPLKRIPKAEEIEQDTFVKDPTGMTMVPPGLALANLFERELGVQFNKTNLETLRERLPKLLIEDLELVQDVEMHVDGNDVRMKFIESMYSDFCGKLRTSTNVCASLGCPICSAMACVLAQATGKPVEFDKDSYTVDGRTVETSYRILDW